MNDGPDPYAVLGVSSRADGETIRRAWLALVKELHPDRVVDDPIARRRSEEAVRRVNEAWRVLGDPVARAEYDARHDPMRRVTSQSGAAPSTASSVRPTLDRRPSGGGGSHVVWGWIAVVGLVGSLIVVLVFSAYATSSNDSPSLNGGVSSSTSIPIVGSCVAIAPSEIGPVAATVECSAPNSGRVVAVVESPRPCPSGVARQLADHRTTLCVVAS